MKNRTYFSVTAIAAACIIAATYGVQWLIMLLASFLNPMILDSIYFEWLASYLPLFVVGMGLFTVIIRRLPKQELYRPGMTMGYWMRALCVCMTLLFGGSLLGAQISRLVYGAQGSDVAEFNGLLEQSPIWLVIVIVVVVGPILEEFIFRKLILDRLVVFGDAPAILFSAILFMLYHATFSQMFYSFLIGLVFGYVYIRSGKLRYTIALHMVINFLGTIVGMLFMRYGGLSPQLSTESLSTLSGGTMAALAAYELFLIAAFILGIAFLIKALRRLDLRPGERSMRGMRIANPMFLNIGFAVNLAEALFILLVVR